MISSPVVRNLIHMDLELDSGGPDRRRGGMTDARSDWPLGRGTVMTVNDSHEMRRQRSMGSLVALETKRHWSVARKRVIKA